MIESDSSGSVAPTQLSDRYTIIRELGRGGMARVYLARDAKYDRDVAIKILNEEISQGVGAERFLREIAVAAKLTHPHIVPLLDSGATDGRLWFAMPLIEGQSLRDRLDREHQLSLAETTRITCDVAEALAYAHAHGVVHRDIKPENILLTGGSAVVSDFGLARSLEAAGSTRLTHTGITVGTALYMSPEQAAGEDVDVRTDVYSLASTTYEMLTGEPPYVGKSVQAVIAKRFSDPIPSARRLRDTVPPALDDVLARALAKSRADRFETADEFMAAVAKATQTSSDTVPVSASAPMSVAPASPRRRSWLLGIAAVVLVIAGAAAYGLRGVRRSTTTTGDPHRPRSIAVVPFTNLSQDKDQEYFSAGMTDELLNALSSIKQLRVAARASSYAASNRTSDVKSIGKTLNVESVLEGSVRKDGDRVRISVELVSTADGFRIWNNTYEEKLSDVFSMQERIAQEIVSAVNLQLGGQRTLVRRPTDDVEAYQMYLRGRHAIDMRTPAALEDATNWFRKAVDRDPLYARAWAGLADVYILQGLNFYAPPKDAYAKSEAAAKRALSLDSTLAEAHTSMATVLYLYDLNLDSADREFQRAIALDPSFPGTHYFYALMLLGKNFDKAEAEARRAQELDPLSPPVSQGIGIVRVGAAHYRDAIEPLRAAIALDPNYYFPHAWLSVALAHAGDPAEAVAEAKRAVALNPSSPLVLSFLAEAYAITGDRKSALDLTARLDSIAHVRSVCGVYVARVYDRLGDADRAFTWLDYAVKAREGQLIQLRYPDTFPGISKDPRFAQLLRQLKLD